MSLDQRGRDLRGWDDTFDDGMRASIIAIIHAARGPEQVGWMRTRWWQRRAMRKYGYLFHAVIAQAHANKDWPSREPWRRGSS